MRWFWGIFCTLLLVGPPVSVWSAESPAVSDSCMVVSAHPVATKLGLKILREGGNAVDAAVAVSFCLAGCEPYSSGLGGGGFFVAFNPLDGQVQTLDARETAPLSAHHDMFLVDGKPVDSLSCDGPLATGVPGLVAGLWQMHKNEGRLPWSTLVKAAAESVHRLEVSPMLHERIEHHQDRFNPAARLVFMPLGRVPEVGEVLLQDDLYQTLLDIADQGPKAFYSGDRARAMVDVTTDAKGPGLTLADLKAYQPRWRPAIHGNYRNHEIYSMAPPSSGGVHLVQMLNILEGFDLQGAEPGSADAIHLLAEAMKFAYADRSRFLGDSDFVAVPITRLAGRAHADSLRGLILLDKAYPESKIVGADLLKYESNETTHLSILDTEGGAVSATLTINLTFGSGRMAPGTGVLMNNEMDDFVAAPGSPNAFGLVGGEANSIAPGKRPLSSMTPTLVLKDGKVRMITGAPGGSKIITTTLQTIVNVLDHRMDALQAVSAERVHHQWFPRVLYFEEFRLSPDTRELLERRGHILKSRSPMCNAQIIVIDPESRRIEGASDPRGMGLAAGF